MTKLTQEQKEIKILKALVHAQCKMIQNYRVGMHCIPESAFKGFADAKRFYKIQVVSEI